MLYLSIIKQGFSLLVYTLFGIMGSLFFLYIFSTSPFLPEQTVDLVDDVPQLVVGVGRGQLQFEDEAVDLVHTDGDGQPLRHGVFQESLCV